MDTIFLTGSNVNLWVWGGEVGRRDPAPLNCYWMYVNPLSHGGGGRCTPPPSLSFCLLLKIFIRHPYLKILYLANLFVADAPMKKNQEI